MSPYVRFYFRLQAQEDKVCYVEEIAEYRCQRAQLEADRHLDLKARQRYEINHELEKAEEIRITIYHD